MCLSFAPVFSYPTHVIYLLIEYIVYYIFIALYIFSSVDLAYDCSSCSLVGRLSYSAFHNPALL
jgi:hypothetical protein